MAGAASATRTFMKGVDRLMAESHSGQIISPEQLAAARNGEPVTAESAETIRARMLIAEGRLKDGVANVESKLREIAALAAHDARKAAEKEFAEQRAQLAKANNIRIVASFMALVQALGQSNGGPLPASAILPGLMVAKVYDALARAGYTESGKTGGMRAETEEAGVMGKSHAEVRQPTRSIGSF